MRLYLGAGLSFNITGQFLAVNSGPNTKQNRVLGMFHPVVLSKSQKRLFDELKSSGLILNCNGPAISKQSINQFSCS